MHHEKRIVETFFFLKLFLFTNRINCITATCHTITYPYGAFDDRNLYFFSSFGDTIGY